MNKEEKLNDNQISSNNNSQIEKTTKEIKINSNEENKSDEKRVTLEIPKKNEENSNNNTEILNKSNNLINSKFKSSLRGSYPKIKKIKKEIMEIFNDKKIIEKLNHFQNEYNSINNNIDNFILFQEQYENNLEEVFNDKMRKIDEINEKYEPELNELYNYMEDDEKNLDEIKKDSEKVPSAIKIMYDSILEDKNNEIKKINKDYDEKRNEIKNGYLKKIEDDKIMKSEYYFSELFDNIKDDILKIINPVNNKKVSFLNEGNESKEDNNEIK